MAVDSRVRRWLIDAVALVAIAAFVLPLYLATMYPDVLAQGDSGKFQYLGSVLGTAHPPGYPFYIFVSYLFSFVPLGTLAWRMNFLSVVAGLLAVLCTYGCARRLRCGAPQAALLAIGLATGVVFWNKSLAAEVYTIGAMLLMFAIWRILAWRDTREERDLLLAVAALSLGVGNHLTIAVVAPAFVAYVLLIDAKRVLRPRTIAWAVGLIALGFLQYGFIAVRTWQQTPYLEAEAHSLGELVDVVRAEKYNDAVFEMGWSTLIHERLPLIGRQLLEELRPIGAIFVVLGLLFAIARRPREALLIAGSSGAILALTANVDADAAGFATAALPPLWLLAAFAPGMQRDLQPRWRAALAAAASVLLVVNVVAEARGNLRFADHSDRTIERRLWSAVFAAVPDRTAIVAESYIHDQSLKYMLIGEHVGEARGIQLVGRDVPAIDAIFSQGRTVIAFEEAARELQRSGFEFTRLPLLDRPVTDLIGSSRRDRFVVAAMQPDAAALLASEAPQLMQRFGGTWKPDRNAGRYALVGVPRNGASAVEAREAGDVQLQVPAGRSVGPSAVLPKPVDVRIVPGEIVIRVGAEEPFRTTAPLAFVVLGEHGQIRERLVPATAWTLRPPLEAVAAYKLTVSTTCENIGDRGWHDASRLRGRELLVHVNNYQQYDARAVVYVGSDAPLAPTVKETRSPEPPRVTVESIARSERAARLAADGVTSPALAAAAHVTRIELRVNDHGDESATIFDLGAEATAIWALGEADRVAPPRVRVCRRTAAR
jgi:transmembrane protein TMEM260 (protein O-mannosyltransferase)